MLEKDFQLKFGKWVKYRFSESAAFELKEARDKPLPILAVKEHQLIALNQANKGLFSYKIPDSGFQNPFDFVTLYKVPAYIVIHYKGDEAVMIPVDTFKRIVRTGVKSISEAVAKEFGTIINVTD